MSSRECALWLDERWYQALSRQLQDETVEDRLANLPKKLLEQVDYAYQDIVIRFQTLRQDMAEQTEGNHAEKFDQSHGPEMAM